MSGGDVNGKVCIHGRAFRLCVDCRTYAVQLHARLKTLRAARAAVSPEWNADIIEVVAEKIRKELTDES
jgi:hypothetical protein